MSITAQIIPIEGAPARAETSLRDTAVARWSAAGLLLVAAYLKWQQAYDLADFGGFGAWAKWSTIALIAGEVVFAFWLLCGVVVPVTKWLAVGVFGAFACYNAYRWLGGYATCGCFGVVKIDPRVTMGVDAAVAGLFLLSRTGSLRGLNWKVERRLLALTCSVPLLLAVPAAATLATVTPPSLTANGIAGQAGGMVRLNPEEWVGYRLPLLPYIEGVNADVGRGEWQVVLMHPDCGHCADALPELVEEARTSNERRTLLLNVSPKDETTAVTHAAGDVAKLYAGRLDPTHLWNAETPHYISVSDGTVTDVY